MGDEEVGARVKKEANPTRPKSDGTRASRESRRDGRSGRLSGTVLPSSRAASSDSARLPHSFPTHSSAIPALVLLCLGPHVRLDPSRKPACLLHAIARTLFECAPMVLPTTGRAYTTSSARASLEVLQVASYVYSIFTLT